MKKEIPFFSARKINEVENYERFFHTKAYLRQKAPHFNYYKGHHDEFCELAIKSGYSPKKLNKFKIHREQWHQLQREIPLSYLETIGADLKIIEFTTELDLQEYEQVLNVPLFPRYAFARLMPAIYHSIKLPPGLSEEEALKFLQDYSKRKKIRCCINYPDIKTVCVTPAGDVSVTYYEPRVKITKTHLVPAKDGRLVGKSFVL